jgi:hypothetical protein
MGQPARPRVSRRSQLHLLIFDSIRTQRKWLGDNAMGCGQVIYESRLDAVPWRSFPGTSVSATIGVRSGRPDYLWDTDYGPVVVDVVRAERMVHPKIVALSTSRKTIGESLGRSYVVVNEPSVISSGM